MNNGNAREKFALAREEQELPDEPGDAVRACVADVDRVVQHPGYNFNMNYWHGWNTDEEETCSVCLGGARLARIIKDKKEVVHEVGDARGLSNSNKMKIASMDRFGRGFWPEGIDEFFGRDTGLLAEFEDYTLIPEIRIFSLKKYGKQIKKLKDIGQELEDEKLYELVEHFEIAWPSYKSKLLRLADALDEYLNAIPEEVKNKHFYKKQLNDYVEKTPAFQSFSNSQLEK